MSLYEKIKNDLKIARLTGNAVKVSLLSVLLGEIQNSSGKMNEDGVKIYSDSDVVSIVKKHIKTGQENLSLDGVTDFFRQIWEKDISILEEYLPQQLTESEIRSIMKTVDGNTMGELMKHMKENYSGLYDGKVASSIAKELTQ